GPAAPARTVPTFREVAQEALERHPKIHAVARTTMENHASFTTHHLLPYFGDMRIDAITVDTVEAFIEAKRAIGGSVNRPGKALSDSTLRTGLAALRLILRRAVRRGLILANPMNEVEWRPASHVEHVDPFSGAELRAILSAAEQLEPDFA